MRLFASIFFLLGVITAVLVLGLFAGWVLKRWEREMTKEYVIKDRKMGLYFVGHADGGRYELGSKRRARRFHSASFAAYVVEALSKVAEGPFEIEKIRR